MAGIYIHIPFCKQACNYCNFHFSTSLALKDAMLQAINKEIATKPKVENAIETIYFGGGTPGILPVCDIEDLLTNIKNNFSLNTNTEITLEANPDDISTEKLNAWKIIGINRLSLGVQSFDDAELKWMNRAHKASAALEAIAKIHQAGYENFSVDLIFGSPLQTKTQLQQNLEIITEFNVPHISCYALTVEDKTKLGRDVQKKIIKSPDSELQAEMYLQVKDFLTGHGYQHYETSSYCKPGYKSRHNSNYWCGVPYIGFGPSAHSYDGYEKRSWNIANNALYIKYVENNQPYFEEEILTLENKHNEYVMLALRTADGLSLHEIEKRFGTGQASRLQKIIDQMPAGQVYFSAKGNVCLSAQASLYADGIAAQLFI